MGHNHGHAPAVHAGARHRWRLLATCAMVMALFLLELITALSAHSLALLSDAGHMAADVITLVAALIGTTIAARPDRSGRRTYGSYRAEVFASGVAVLVMVAVSLYVGYEAIHRIGGHPATHSEPLIVVGAIGLVVNVVSMMLLRDGAQESLNVKGAYLEVLADAVGSVGVIVAGILIALTGLDWWDSVIAVAIAIFVLVRAVLLGREVVAVLGQHAPDGVDPEQVRSALGGLPGIRRVHDLHLWTLTSGMNVATAHLVIGEHTSSHDVLDQAQAMLTSQFGIEHATLQVEPESHTQCQSLQW
ncbi:cation diffusion facilitator family transporter [Leekyejoonella antrihumi]|uniref:Cation transporter n=1 Tax=Leekyejoonella antrihumi TaxID=1660198 RepID=A0A563DWC1_9MICO|nr:cation diffusion facilitator family transporter [Leekyejoonella antrihumi]TWP34233.1 cation transporter [Leekyejoonella antrihumi]